MKKKIVSLIVGLALILAFTFSAPQKNYAANCFDGDRAACLNMDIISKIPSSLIKIKIGGAYVNLSKFTTKVRGTSDYKNPSTGWVISKNKGTGHGGSAWKLINKKGKRIATLSKDGKILRE